MERYRGAIHKERGEFSVRYVKDPLGAVVGFHDAEASIREAVAAERERWNDPAAAPVGKEILVLSPREIWIGVLHQDREGRRWWGSADDLDAKYERPQVLGWRELPPIPE